jgi:hypothetical protein
MIMPPLTPRKMSLGLYATVKSMADLVDSFAIVEFLKCSSAAISRDDFLRPTGIYTKRDCNGELEHSIMFRTESEFFPIDIEPKIKLPNRMCLLSHFSLRGSDYKLAVVHGEPKSQLIVNNRHGSVIIPRAFTICDLERVKDDVARLVALRIGECLSDRFNLKCFLDATTSRFKYFARIRLDVTLDHIPPPTLSEDVAAYSAQRKTRLPDEMLQRMKERLRERNGLPDRKAFMISNFECSSTEILIQLIGENTKDSHIVWKDNVALAPTHFSKWSLYTEFSILGGESRPFVKPEFVSLKHLIASFATHARDQKSEQIYALPLFGIERINPALMQPLVFCHTLA